MRVLRRLLGMWAFVFASAVVAGAVVRLTVRSENDQAAPRFSLVTVFDGTEFRPTTRDLIASKALTMFGGTRIDLRRASTTGTDPVRLDLTTIMGGIDITVPDSWKVTVRGVAVGGGHDIHVADHESLPADAPQLAIHARTVMGGVRVQARPVLQSADLG